jgi:tRNA pseudouridine32 synthase
VLINGTIKSTLETIIRDGDYISHKLHRHEPPVSDRPVGIVYEDDRIMAINKPAGVPVHPAGRYHFNSVVEILKFERGGDWNPLRMLFMSLAVTCANFHFFSMQPVGSVNVRSHVHC